MDMVIFISKFLSSVWMPIIFYSLLKSSIEKERLLIGNLINILVVYLASIILMNEISFVIACAIIALVFINIFKCRKLQLLIIPLAYIIVVFCNYVVEVLFIRIGYVEDSGIINLQTNFIVMCVITVLIFIVSISLSFIIGKIQNQYEMAKNRELSILIVGNFALCTFAFLINSWITRKNDFTSDVAMSNLLIFGGYMFLTLLISIIIFKVFANRQKMRMEKEQYENLKEYTTQIETMYQSIRAFKHDYVNILTSIAGYLEAEKYEELNTYFNDNILKESRKLTQDDFKLNMLSNIKEPGLKGLISSKLIYAHEIGIKVVIDILDEVEEFYINIFDLNRIMGIFLDNAIEAAGECKDNKEIRFNVIKEEKAVVITLMNTFEVDEVDINNIEKNGYSTKGENRGLGLYNVKEILKKYRSVLKSTSVQEGFFVQSLVLQK